jgi:hypothetical protein
MSINTLKRKTNAKYNNSSVNQKQFSINGGTRNQGWVGQTSLSRTVNRTLFHDGYPRGYGGCCGTYRITNVISSDVNTTENSNIIKKSVLSTYGQLESEFRPEKFITFKPDSTTNSNQQNSYISNVSTQTINTINNCTNNNNTYISQCNTFGGKSSTNYNNLVQNFSVTKSASNVLKESDYIIKLVGCQSVPVFNVQKNTNGLPVP